MRIRLVDEMVLHQNKYLSDEYVARGWPSQQTPLPTVGLYIDLCSNYARPEAGETLDLTHIYNKEANDILRLGNFMGVFQLFALASVLGCPLVSVYPNKGDPVARKYLHRLILPRVMTSSVPRFIMWTRLVPTSDDFWAANHFIILVPYNGEEAAELEECELL